ncbi:DNA-binding response regulator [Sulfitobacter sp. SK012]|uniref:response regulator transcription factor n=1 Tax=Sulfitobacter sp. SK012 TaxID=1389005 RepID=UPI000E0A3149|nr:response regulator transcription factor [Sulfitobacter sp. SK012]AXI44711.1 DNA-binding response regulator [Sulfitobacter sp. SK012]
MRIVIVEDNISVARGIAYVLRDSGHAVDLLHDGQEADVFLRGDGGDVIVLDINLPGLSGIDVLRGLRQRGDTRPVLLLTARSSTGERIQGLDAGADDYLIKPFEMAELEARIRALARRRDVPVLQPMAIGALQFDPQTRQVTGPDGPIELPRKELSVFEAMILLRGRTVSKSSLLDSVYGTGADVDAQVVEVYVSRLRKRLKPHGVEIRVQRGLGYVMQSAKE